MPPQLTGLEAIFGNAVKAVIALAGIVLFIMLITGGVKYITSGGDPKAAEGAKNTITYAIGGLLLILLSYVILVILGTITGTNLTNFIIRQGP